ncbi:MAG: hypothetical protein ACUZ8H_05530 [Candidatus Anammoxibacter sp.]
MRTVGNSITDTSVNCNTNANGTALKSSGAKYASLLIKEISGAHGTHVVTIQVSENGTDWQDTSHTLTGTGILEGVIVIGKFVRSRVTTAQGGASVCDIALILR